MRPLKVKVSITLDADLTDSIRALAEADDRTFSQYINLVLKEHVASMSAAMQNSAAQNSAATFLPQKVLASAPHVPIS